MSEDLELIGVTGGTGRLGRLVSDLLDERGIRQLLLIRDRGHAREPLRSDVEFAELPDGFDDPGLTRALGHVSTLLLLPACGPEMRERNEKMIRAATDARVARIVYLSMAGASEASSSALLQAHGATEFALMPAGCQYRIARANVIAEWLPAASAPGGDKPIGPMGLVAPIRRRDLAEALVALILGDGFDYGTFELGGPEAIRMPIEAITSPAAGMSWDPGLASAIRQGALSANGGDTEPLIGHPGLPAAQEIE